MEKKMENEMETLGPFISRRHAPVAAAAVRDLLEART